MTSLYQQLARPVVRGYLSFEQAMAALTVRAVEAERDGTAEGIATLDERMRLDRHFLSVFVESLEEKRDAIALEIKKAVLPLATMHAPIGRLRADAHDINADRAFLLTEAEVEDVVVDALRRHEEKLRWREGLSKPLAHAPARRRRRR